MTCSCEGPGARLRDWLAGVLAPAMIGIAIFLAIRGRPVATTLVAFGIAIVVAHVVIVLAGAVLFRSPPNR